MRLFDYPASSNCYKVRLLLAQLGRDYERVNVDIFGGETLTEEFGRINPARTTPVLETDDGRYLPESNAILFYLGEGTPFLPDDPFERAQVVRWLIFEQTDVIPTIGGLRFRLLTGRLKASDPEAVACKDGALTMLRLLEDELAAREFFVADRYTIADIALYAYTHRPHEAGIDVEPFQHLRAWHERVRSQPGFVDDLEPYGANAAPGAGRSLYS